jgi:hypothetical protein
MTNRRTPCILDVATWNHVQLLAIVEESLSSFRHSVSMFCVGFLDTEDG